MFLFSPGPEPCLYMGEERYDFFPVRRVRVALAHEGGCLERLTLPESVIRGLSMKEIFSYEASSGCRTELLLAAAYAASTRKPAGYAVGLWLRNADPWQGDTVCFSPLRSASRTIDPFDTRLWCIEGVMRLFDAVAISALGDLHEALAASGEHRAGELVCIGCEVHPTYTPGLTFEAGANGVGLVRLQWN